jgi:hypothetical protein
MFIEMQKLSYSAINALLAKQERFVAEGKMVKPEVKYGFSPRQRQEFDNGISIEDYAEKHEIFYEEKSCNRNKS